MKLLSGLVIASAIATAAASSTRICITQSGISSVSPIPRTTVTTKVKKTKTIIRTTHPTSTATAPGTTIVITSTTTVDSTTTLSTSTDTVSTTVFETTTTTSEAPPVTVTDTETSSTTTTSTVGPFFTGVQDTLPGADPYTGSAKRDVNERAENAPRGLSEPRLNMLRARDSITLYPTAVTCSKIFTARRKKRTTITKTGTTVTTTVTGTPVTNTDTSTVTNTVTINPSHASTTETITSTITDTEIDTMTSTTSTTVTTTETDTVQASPTVACDSSNYASSANGGNAIINATPDDNSEDFGSVSAASLTACCDACAANPSCGAFSYQTSNGQCNNAITSGTCSVNGDGFQALLASSSPNGRTTPVVVGNGLCGAYDNYLG